VIADGSRSSQTSSATSDAFDPARILDDLDAGRRRAAWPDPQSEDGWRIDPTVKTDILARFANRATRQWEVGPLAFRDRIGLPTKALLADSSDSGSGAEKQRPDRPVRIVPGGTSVRAGAFLGPGVVVMPPAFINVGAWIGEDSMVDSHVLVGSCAQIGARVHLAAGVQIGGVLEPPGARPVIVEDDVFVGAGSAILEGVLVGSGAVIAAGVVLTGTSRLYDLVRKRVIAGSQDRPLVVPARSVVVPGTRPLEGRFAGRHGLAVATAIIVKDRDAGTDARTALESALRAGPGGTTA
jgi:2,3,4,5-tetrahydropyridine-2,6-dicarboxylate N-succinyltransferase